MAPGHPMDNPATTDVPPQSEPDRSDLAVYLGTRPGMADRDEYLFFLFASIVFLLGILAFLGYIYLDPVRERLYQIVLDRERIRAVMNRAGSWAPFLFILVQAAQVVLMVWPVPLEIAGGFLFGLPLGVFYSATGLALGSMVAFLLGRWLERKFVTRLHPEKMQRFQRLIKREGTLAAFLIFLIPGFPKDFVCYFLGATRLSLSFFLVASILLRLPSTVLFTLQGAEVYAGNYGLILGLGALYVLLALMLFRKREALYRWVSRWHLEAEQSLS
jgi:uncharacterized membrane protein YdjX (TVP38/TMEM64 family)